MIFRKIAIFGFILSITNFHVAGQTLFYAPLNGDKCYDICTSRECNDAASRILKNMDPEINPCTDFYKFACGGFAKNETIPTYLKGYDMNEMMSEKIKVALRVLIEANIEDNEIKPFVVIKKFYKSCVNADAINDSWLKRLRNILKKLGGWPLVVGDRWDESNFDWRTSMSKFRKIGDNANYFIDYGIVYDARDNTKCFIVLRRPPTSIEYKFQHYGINNETKPDDLTSMRIFAELLGAHGNDSEFNDTYAFERKLYNIITSVDKSSDANVYKPMTIAELNATYTGVRWKDYINDILPSDIKVDDNDIVFLHAPSYFSKLISLMSETSTRIHANYVFRKFVQSASHLIAVADDPSIKPRWLQCVEIVNENVPLIVGAMYAREYVTDEQRKNVEEIVTVIRQQMKDTLRQASWMQEETRKAAIEKVTAMNIRVGYPDELLNDTSLKEYHANLTFSNHNYFGNMFKMASFVHYNAFNDLRKSPKRTDWGNNKQVAIVEARYTGSTNALRIPAGILGDIYYGRDRPDYLNYGAIGMIIGHEIGHGFDVRSRNNDKDGNIRDWWESTTKLKYSERVNCTIEQYLNYMVDEIKLKVDVTRTQDEIIADNIGTKLAYEAYVRRKLQSSNVEEPRLRGLEKYSPRQMFWIIGANTWCERLSENYLPIRVIEDVHPIAEYRVIGPLSNIKEFAIDFQCSKVLNTTNVHSRMISEKRCSAFG